MALLAPLAAGALVLLAAAIRGLALPWAAAGLALAGNVLLGFAVACVARTRTGEPGAAAGTAVVLVLMAPSLVPQVARWVRTFPAPGAGGPSSDTVWWIVLAVCVVAIAISIGGRQPAPVDVQYSVIPLAFGCARSGMSACVQGARSPVGSPPGTSARPLLLHAMQAFVDCKFSFDAKS